MNERVTRPPEYRRDPVLGQWVIIAPERAARPMALSHSKPHARRDAERDVCPFCEGAEANTPGEVYALRRQGTLADTPGWSLRVVPNRFPAVRPDLKGRSHTDGRNDAVFESVPGFGLHDVVIECPDHATDPVLLSDMAMKEIFITYRERMLQHSWHQDVTYVTVFKNVGAEAGASIAHTHSQIVSTPILPEVIRRELGGAEHFYQQHRRCVFCDMITCELQTYERVVAETPNFVAICPFASRFAYEVWVVPKTHDSRYETIRDEQAHELGQVMKMVLGKIDALLAQPAYNYFIHTGPARAMALAHYHWHLEIIPRTSRAAGFEWGSGCFINAVPPEKAAEQIRNSEIDSRDHIFD